MLATFAALALSLPAEMPTFTVEFRVMRVPAGRGTLLLRTAPNGFTRYDLFPDGKQNRVLSDARANPGDIKPDHLVDASGLPGYDSGNAPWVRKAELTGPTLRVSRTPMTERMTAPLWAVVTHNKEPLWHSAWQSVRIESREVLVADATFTASAVPVDGGRIELCVTYTEGELSPAKDALPPMSPLLSPFYPTDTPAPQPFVPAFRAPPRVNAADTVTLKAGETFMLHAGRSVRGPANTWLCTRADGLTGWWQSAEDDVIVFATVR